jgi:nucleoside-diphosphate-sugar epimerase
MTRQRILIAGCGYLGQRVAVRLLSRGCDVFAMTRSQGRAAMFSRLGMTPIVYSASGDRLSDLPVVDIVLWSVGYDRSADRQLAWTDGLLRLLTSLPDVSALQRICLTSSTGVYGDHEGHDVDEGTPVNPTSEGGIGCTHLEALLQEFCRTQNVHTSVFRLAGIYGPDRLLRRVSELRSGIPISAEPDHWLNLIHVDDAAMVVDSVMAASAPDAARPFEPPQLMNVVAAKSVTRRDYYSTLARLIDAPEPVFTLGGSADPAQRRQRRNGNRRILSRVRPLLPVSFLFDDHEIGLEHAVRYSDLPSLT